MAKYSFGQFEIGPSLSTDFGTLLSIIKGRSIVSAADWGNDRFELGLSGNLMVRFFQTGSGMTINLISTRNIGENPTLVIDMGDMQQRVPIHLIESKLNALRTLYAIYYLINDNREKELENFILNNPTGDIEQSLLHPDEQLFIESISYGSWVLTVWAKTQKAYKSIVSVGGLVFERGREAFLSKLEADSKLKGAEAKLKNAEADLKETEVTEKQFDIAKKQFDYLLEVSDKIDSPEAKALLKDKLIEATKKFTLGDRTDSESYKRLG